MGDKQQHDRDRDGDGDRKAEYCVTPKDIDLAKERIKGLVHETPVLTSATMDRLNAGSLSLVFKCENLQKGGSFKIRGAVNSVLLLPPECKDVVTHSSGNHGQALAIAANQTGVQAHIVVPSNAPTVKKDAMEDYGADLIVCEPTQQAREATAQETLDRIPNSVFVPPFDYPNVIAGQGTLGLEIMEQVPDVEAVVVPVGGGGMLGGIALAIKSRFPHVLVIGAEPELADDTYRSFQSKTRMENASYPATIADGVRVNVGKLTFPIIRDFVDEVFLISEQDIIAAQRLVLERMKLVIEPTAGVSVGVALSPAFGQYAKAKGISKVAVVLCGGNQDIDKFPWVIDPKWNQG